MDREDLKVGTRVAHQQYGEGIITKVSPTSYNMIFVRGGETSFSKLSDNYDIIEEPEGELAPQPTQNWDLNDITEVLGYLLDERGIQEPKEEIPMGDKWHGGNLIMEPGREGVQGKEIPIETFYKKIISVREKLRVLEQNINNHNSLNEAEKIHLQQYITKAYGSLTSFNVLFQDKEDHFSGVKA